MSVYPKIYKVEAILCHHNRMHISIYEVSSGWDYTPGFREANGPNYLFEVDMKHPECPGFTTLLMQARDFGFNKWGDHPYMIRITDGEAPVERHHMIDWGGHVVAHWEGNAKKPIVHDSTFKDWIDR